MGEDQKTVVLDGGKERDVALVDGAAEFVKGLLGGAAAKTGIAALRLVRNDAGRPFVAVFIGGKHVGFLSRGDTEELLAPLSDLGKQGAVAMARGVVSATTGNGGTPMLRLNLAAPGELGVGPGFGGSSSLVTAPASPAVAPAPAVAPQAPVDAYPAATPGPRMNPAPLALQPVLGLSGQPVGPDLNLAPVVVPVAGAGLSAPYAGMLGTPQAPTYCPRCGAPLQSAGGQCRCGHVLAGGGVRVVGDRLVGRSPMVLPHGCVACGRDALKGRRFNRTLYTFPLWTVVIMLFSLLIGLVVYFVVRKPLEIGYSLCPECAEKRTTRRWMALGAWILFVALIAASIAMHGSMIVILLMIAAFIGAVVMSVLAGARIRVSGHELGVFTVKGASQTFLAGMARSAG